MQIADTKRSKFLLDFCWRDFFSLDLIIADKRKIFQTRDNWISHKLHSTRLLRFKIVFFFQTLHAPSILCFHVPSLLSKTTNFESFCSSSFIIIFRN